jgi:hypothetical protein
MICGRAEATFSSVAVSQDGAIRITITLDSGISSSGSVYIYGLPFYEKAPEDFHIQLRHNKHVIKIFFENELVFATTPDDVLMRRGRKQSAVVGFDNFRDLLTFDLLYVGIAKENQDSYSRLIERGHKARMDILAAEEQRVPGARVSDETYLLLFAVEPLILTTFGGDGDISDDDLDFSFNYHRIIADAEKAVISSFKPKYNKQLYNNYPRGTDGLYRQGYNGYSYAIAEGFAFNTAYGTIKGARDSEDLLLSNDADFISIIDDDVTIHISGQDFNVKAEKV